MMLIINLLVALVAFLYGLWAINHMTHRTRHGMRLAWLAITTGALGILVSPLYGHVAPTLWETVLNVGIALHVVFERRRPTDGAAFL